MQARHDDVGGGVRLDFNDELFEVGRVAVRVSDHEVRLIGNSEMPCPASQVLPRARITDHLLVANLRRIWKQFRDLLLPRLTVAEHVCVAGSECPDQKRTWRIKAMLQFLQRECQMLTIRRRGLRHIIRRTFRLTDVSLRFISDDAALRRFGINSVKSRSRSQR